MKRKVCYNCPKRELHCKSWCKDWAKETEEVERDYEAKRKADFLHGAFVNMQVVNATKRRKHRHT